MRFIRTWYGVQGSGRLAAYALRWSRMVTEQAKRRARILAFWAKYGTNATVEAFETSRSRAPQQRRSRSWPSEILQEIRRLRTIHPNLGKEKVWPELTRFCHTRNLRCPSLATIGRLIADAPDKMRTTPSKVRHNGKIVPRKRRLKARKPKGFVAQRPGDCLAFDAIERIRSGCRRYVLTNLDCYDRFGLALGTNSHSSVPTTTLLRATQASYPHRLGASLTDNGSEFQRRFDEALRLAGIPHWHTFPRTP